jgi:hypothetical protein
MIFAMYGFNPVLEKLRHAAMKTSVRWLLFEYKGLELVILSKPYETKELADKARQKYPDRIRRKIGIGVMRVK